MLEGRAQGKATKDPGKEELGQGAQRGGLVEAVAQGLRCGGRVLCSQCPPAIPQGTTVLWGPRGTAAVHGVAKNRTQLSD